MEFDQRYRWYKIELKDENFQPCTYTFRGANRRELRLAGTKENKFDADQFLLETLVYPQKNWDTMLAGVCTRLLKEIYHYTGLDEDGITFAEAIDWTESETGRLEQLAVVLIPSCSMEVIETCDPFHYAKFLITAKVQLESFYGISIEQWLGKHVDEAGIERHQADRASLKPNEVGHDVTQFAWKKGQAIHIDPSLVDKDTI